jgi:TPR repeat protein
LTAHPWDPEKLTDGIYWNKVPAARAVLACRLAVRANPSARNMYQFARALAKSREFSEAAEWYKKSANRGYVQAQYSLGDAYEFGEGVQVNYVLAQRWYKKAAERGYTHAADRLNKLVHASITNTRQQMATADTRNTSLQ